MPMTGTLSFRASLTAIASLRLTLGAYEEDDPALGRQLLDVLKGLLEQAIGLLQVDDVDPVALAEDVFLHLRVPALGLVPEVDPRLEQLLHGDRGGHVRIHARRQKPPPDCPSPGRRPGFPASRRRRVITVSALAELE